MGNLDLVVCATLKDLAGRLNDRLYRGKAISFSNNGGVFVKDGRRQVVVKLRYYHLNDATESGKVGDMSRQVGLVPSDVIMIDGLFFRAATEGEAVGCRTTLKAPKDALIYGPSSRQFGYLMTSYFPKDSLNSRDCAPISGELAEVNNGTGVQLNEEERLVWVP